MNPDLCPCCGGAVQVVTSDEGTSAYIPVVPAVLADAERFVEQLLVSKTAVQWGALFLLKEGTTRLPARVVAEELLAALRAARGVGEEG